jgi:hypothetical protein
MRIVTLEDHFATPMFQERFPQGNVPGHFLADRGRYLGYDISAELMNLGDSRLAAMDATGIDVQVVSLTMPAAKLSMAKRQSQWPRMPTTGWPKRYRRIPLASRDSPHCRPPTQQRR